MSADRNLLTSKDRDDSSESQNGAIPMNDEPFDVGSLTDFPPNLSTTVPPQLSLNNDSSALPGDDDPMGQAPFSLDFLKALPDLLMVESSTPQVQGDYEDFSELPRSDKTIPLTMPTAESFSLNDNGGQVSSKAMREEKSDQDVDKIPSLHEAVETNDLSTIKMLLTEAKADVNAFNDDDETPLYCALVNNSNLDVVKYLLNAKADIKKATDDEDFPIHVAASASPSEESSAREFFISHALSLNDPELVNQKFNGNVTPLMLAAHNGHATIFKSLYQSTLVEKQSSVLHIAAGEGHLELVEFLVKDKKVDVNEEDNNGHTALDLAKLRKQSDVIQFLEGMKAHSNIVLKDSMRVAGDNSTHSSAGDSKSTLSASQGLGTPSMSSSTNSSNSSNIPKASRKRPTNTRPENDYRDPKRLRDKTGKSSQVSLAGESVSMDEGEDAPTPSQPSAPAAELAQRKMWRRAAQSSSLSNRHNSGGGSDVIPEAKVPSKITFEDFGAADDRSAHLSYSSADSSDSKSAPAGSQGLGTPGIFAQLNNSRKRPSNTRPSGDGCVDPKRLRNAAGKFVTGSSDDKPVSMDQGDDAPASSSASDQNLTQRKMWHRPSKSSSHMNAQPNLNLGGNENTAPSSADTGVKPMALS